MVDEDPWESFAREARALDPRDVEAVKDLAQRVEACDEPVRAADVLGHSRALKEAVGRLRAEALSEQLSRNELVGFVARAAHGEYMDPVDLDALRVPRWMALDTHRCECGAALWIPFPAQGGPPLTLDCPSCLLGLLARPTYKAGRYELSVERDERPARKRRRSSLPG